MGAEEMTFAEFMKKIYPLLKDGTLTRADRQTDIGLVKAYKAGDIIRIDIHDKN
ncbi:hypothetical protein KAR91_33095 [Candidatus Pacearchaeota archaeon]|nr:hypothetical protein [Candidatus Pacearchaeota archaeon]